MLGHKVGLGVQKQHYLHGGNYLHFITASTYRRVCLRGFYDFNVWSEKSGWKNWTTCMAIRLNEGW
jgi:hypothetical protein